MNQVAKFFVAWNYFFSLFPTKEEAEKMVVEGRAPQVEEWEVTIDNDGNPIIISPAHPKTQYLGSGEWGNGRWADVPFYDQTGHWSGAAEDALLPVGVPLTPYVDDSYLEAARQALLSYFKEYAQ